MFKRKLHDIFLIGGLFFILIFGFPQIIHAIVDPIMAEDIRECKQSANSVFDLGDFGTCMEYVYDRYHFLITINDIWDYEDSDFCKKVGIPCN